MICPYASELHEGAGIPSGVFVAPRYCRALRHAGPVKAPCIRERRERVPGYESFRRLSASQKDMARSFAERFRVTVEEMMGPSQFQEPTAARHELWAALSEEGLSHRSIAIMFGRDRSAVRKGIDRWLNKQARKAVAA